MIQTPSTLVLGAGSSYAYGFPTGNQLRSLICSELRRDSGKIYEAIRLMGNSQMAVEEFRSAFEGSEIYSIDKFLANGPNRPFWDVGKAAIAAVLIRLEHEKPLFNPRPRDPTVTTVDHWYRYLWSRMDNSWEGFLSNNLRIITFNYDRSLEMYLSKALSSHNRMSFEQAISRVEQLRILHVYGSLGKLGSIGPTSRPYAPDLDLKSMEVATNSIKVIPEHRKNNDQDVQILEWLRESERICYLGFSYDPINIDRLGLKEALPPKTGFASLGPDPIGYEYRHQKDVLGTTLGLRSQESAVAAHSVQGRFDRFKGLECEEFLREYGVLL